MRVTFSDLAFQTESTTPTPEPLTYDQPTGTLPIVDDARWSSSLTDNSLTALLVWIVLLVMLQAATWPLVRRLFSRFADGGWGFTRLITMLLAGFLVWFPTALEITEFRAVWCWIAMLLVAGASWYWARRFPTKDFHEPGIRRTAIMAVELVFWVTFGVFLLFRFINPDSYEPLWGGEKAMEFAHINSILRSAHFPPVDPWYSGGYLNYYYYGSYLVAFLIKLTGISSEIAFNLALPLFMALLATGLFSLGFTASRALSRSTSFAIASGGIATVLGVCTGNMVAAARTLESLTNEGRVYGWDYWVWGPTRIFSSNITGKYGITEFPYFAGLFGDLHAHVIALPITVLVIGLVVSFHQAYRGVINDEMNGQSLGNLLRASSGRLVLLAIVLGSLFMTNAWDAPTYAVVASLGILASFAGLRQVGWRLITSAAAIAVLGVLTYIVIFPFNQHYVALFSEIGEVTEKTPLLPVAAHFGGFVLVLTAGFALSGPRRETGKLWLLDPTVVLPLLGFVLVVRWYAAGRSDSLIDVADFATVFVIAAVWLGVSWLSIDGTADFGIPENALRGLVVIGALGTIGGIVAERPVFALYLAIGAGAGIAWLSERERIARFAYSFVAVGALLGAALELVFLVDDLDGGPSYRMNTIFKFYNQIWVLFAIASAFFVAMMLSRMARVEPAGQPDTSVEGTTASIRTAWARAGLVVTALVVVLGLAYPAQATGVRLDTRFPHPEANLTLNAYSWMGYAGITYTDGQVVRYEDDLAAIEWFNEEVAGNPVIAEASFGTYRCNGSRFSIATGLPAVIGWERHEQQQRDRTLLPQRLFDLRDLYETTSVPAKLELIEKYNIEYIVVGQTERLYPRIAGNDCEPQDVSAGIAAIESMVGTDLEVAFQQGTTTVYRVVR